MLCVKQIKSSMQEQEVVTKLGGADKTDDEAAYLKAAEGENAGDAFDNLVAAKAAEKASATGEPVAASD
jgi:hypothetical protein